MWLCVCVWVCVCERERERERERLLQAHWYHLKTELNQVSFDSFPSGSGSEPVYQQGILTSSHSVDHTGSPQGDGTERTHPEHNGQRLILTTYGPMYCGKTSSIMASSSRKKRSMLRNLLTSTRRMWMFTLLPVLTSWTPITTTHSKHGNMQYIRCCNDHSQGTITNCLQ